MRRISLFVLLLFVSSCMIFCAGTRNKDTSNQFPEWFLNEPEDPNYLFGVGTGTSRNLNAATDKATADGLAEIARKIATHVSTLQKSFLEEVGAGESSEVNEFFSQATKTIADETLHFHNVMKREVREKDGQFTFFALIGLPVGAASEALMEQLNSNRAMYQRFQATKAFNELKDEVEEYRKFKQNNIPPEF